MLRIGMHWLMLAACALGAPNQRAVPEEIYDDWYFNGSEWVMATTSWLGTVTDSAANASNYSNGLPVTGDDLLLPEDAARAMATDMDAFAGVKATGTLTVTANPTAAETVTIEGKVYTFRASLASCSENDVLIGATASDSLDNLIAAINGAAGSGTTYCASTVAHTQVTAAAGAGDTMDVTANWVGTSGNTVDTTEALVNGSWGAATLTGGTDFVLNLIFIGRGHTWDTGTLADPLLTAAVKIVHQGSGQLFYRASPSGGNDNDEFVLNSPNLIGAAHLSAQDVVSPWIKRKIGNSMFTRGAVIADNSFSSGRVFVGYLTRRQSDTKVTWGTLQPSSVFAFGGSATFAGIPTSVDLYGGDLTLTGTGTTITAEISGGRLFYNSALNINNLTILGGVVDLTATTDKLTIANLWKAPDPIATLYKSDDLVTITTQLDFTGGDTP